MKQMLYLSVLLFAAIYITMPIVDPDLWWHITAGKWMIFHGALPNQDYWNMFGTGKPWRAYSWMFELLVAFTDLLYGLNGLIVLKIFFASLLSFSLFYVLSRLSKDWFFGALLGIFSTSACFSHFTLRPQSLVWVFLIWLIYWLEDLKNNGRNNKNIGFIFIIMCLWANTHITTALGLLTVLFWLFDFSDKKKIILPLILAFTGTLFTPYFGGEWLTFFSKTTHPFNHSAIAEFRAATILEYSTGFVVLAAYLLGYFFYKLQQSTFQNIPGLLLSMLFILAGLAVVKFIPFAVIVSCAVLAVYWKNASTQLGNISEAVLRLKEFIFKIPIQGFTFLFFALGFYNVTGLIKNPINRDLVAVDAIAFIKQKELPFPFMTTFGDGGYMMYSFSGKDGLPNSEKHRVSIDGRTNVVPSEIWEKFLKSFKGQDGWREYIDAVAPESILWRTESPLTPILLNNTEWCEVYRSGTAMRGYNIFVKQEYFLKNSANLHSSNCDPLKK